MEHSLHLAAGHVLSRITPVHTENMPAARNDELDESDDETSAGTATSDEGSAIISHALRKLLGFITQVHILYRICYIH